MGIYDRDYFRQEQPGFSLRMPRSAVVVLIIINAVVYLAEMLSADRILAHFLSTHAAGTPDVLLPWWAQTTLTHPWLWWQLLTCGFVHDPGSPVHILLNMFMLWVLGRDVEEWYGAKEFVRLYLVLLVFASAAWAVVNRLEGLPANFELAGASGAITGIVVLYAMNFPRRTLLFMFVLPMPAWVLGLIVVGSDMLGATGSSKDSHIAYVAHLAGAALAFLYCRQRWHFGRLIEGRFRWPRLRWPRFRGRPPLRIHQPGRELDRVPDEEVDRILEKIHREGEGSLTRKERRFLETASREYQRRRRPER